MIVLEGLESWQNKRCLLGFSGGGDSVALFYLLLEQGVRFDLAIVHYALRDQAHLEVQYALKLGRQHAKSVHVCYAPLRGGNLEARARTRRYAFFARLSLLFGYECVILAHHLNDKLEWFLMQLAQGASLQTLLGFEALENRDRYTLARPLLYTPKSTLKDYLHAHNYRYFEDHSNANLRFKRNVFRHALSDVFLNLKGTPQGLKRSFEALHAEKTQLYPPIKMICIAGVWVFKENNQNVYYIDRLLKRLGYVLSHSQRLELERQHFNTIFSTQTKIYCVGNLGGVVFVGARAHTKPIALPKIYKDQCRTLKIPKTLRHALFSPQWQEHLEAIKQAKGTLCAPSNLGVN
ncbi:tRNA(Ile)-lysidine synthetase [Helicobacter bizzozeronii CIII-1]|uniref:tRNA(Ile)-lysidine synthase n=1 Tax=Helicobacter bizzozeronii (strain CIII-1) TaxID=1002804 RepID=F8KPT7_HELBC|nr:tRNA lysidine(34) synthetase TilS [Helicobacter bizzozeronii]CCB80830.1 tRNA(Ile)-lysidine synthetase [Helicobacter bizzozeronii CIII-1]